MKRRGFTMVEMLIVVAILALLAALLLPAIARARQGAYRATCQSNLRQLGLAFHQYTQDYDETYPIYYPPGLGPGAVPTYAGGTAGDWPRASGQNWGAQLYPYTKNRQIYTCPADPTRSANPAWSAVSYGYNHNIPFSAGGSAPHNHVAEMNQTSRTVLAFEIRRCLSDVSDPDDNKTYSGALGGSYGASLYTPINYTYVLCWQCSGESGERVAFHTGAPFGRSAVDYGDDISQGGGPHFEGSNFLLADGHVKWLKGTQVSGGDTAVSSTSNQTGAPTPWGAAQGTEYDGSDKVLATFSPI